MRTPTRPAALLVMTVVFSFAATFTGCWGPVDKGQPGVRNRVIGFFRARFDAVGAGPDR